MKNFSPLTAILFLFNSLSSFAQFEFVSPQPGSVNLSTGHNIVLREGSYIEASSLQKNVFILNGSISGHHDFNLVLADDGKTIVLDPVVPFSCGEVVTASIGEGLKSSTGSKINPYSFTFTTHREYTAEEVAQLQRARIYLHNAEQNESGNAVQQNSDTRNISGMFTITNNTNPSPGDIFFDAFPGSYATHNYLGYHAVSVNGDSLYSKSTDTIYNNFCLTQRGYFAVNNGDYLRWDVLDSNFTLIDKFYPVNGYEVDNHEFLLLPDGRAFMIANEFQIVDMTIYNSNYSASASVRGSVIQEFDPQHNLIFEWRSFDHIAITEGLHENLALGVIDYAHMNALEVDNDGNLLTSSRHLDQVSKINLSTGEFMWRLGGVNNQFTWINEPEPFTYQHDVRRLANGNITVFDNGNFHAVKHSIAKEYQLDELNHTATLVWSYSNPDGAGGHYFYHAMGNIQRLSNGNTFINWGWRPFNNIEEPSMTEVTAAGTIVWELKMETTDNVVAYRAHKYEWNACARASLSSLKTKKITSNSAKVVWKPAWDAVVYHLQYKKSTEVAWTTVNVNVPKTSCNLSNLAAGTTYKWQLQTWCDASGTKSSGFTKVKKFTTNAVRELMNEAPAIITIYPNPANDIFTVDCQGVISQVRVMNLLGQEQKNILPDEHGNVHQVRVSVGNLTAGSYFVEVTCNEKKEVRRIIKE